MSIHESWEKALKNTDIVRARVQALLTFAETKVPYILLSKSEINLGDTVIRKGEVSVDKPSIILPPHIPQFLGFDFESEAQFNREAIVNFLFVRGVTLPSLKYDNKTSSLDLYEGNVDTAVKHHLDVLQRTEDVHTGLIVGPEDCWQFSVLIFICTQVAKNSEIDIKRLLNEYKKREP